MATEDFQFMVKRQMLNDSNQFSREAWEANAEHWDSRMGDDGNDFFNIICAPNYLRYPLVSD